MAALGDVIDAVSEGNMEASVSMISYVDRVGDDFTELHIDVAGCGGKCDPSNVFHSHAFQDDEAIGHRAVRSHRTERGLLVLHRIFGHHRRVPFIH